MNRVFHVLFDSLLFYLVNNYDKKGLLTNEERKQIGWIRNHLKNYAFFVKYKYDIKNSWRLDEKL